MQVTINFGNTYPTTYVADDMLLMKFDAPQKDGSVSEILIKITEHPDPLLPGVYNLGFGPPDGKGGFLDDIKLHHEDINKVFSTILLSSFAFLYSHSHLTLGLDGSNDQRARLYHRMFKHNQVYLEEYFNALGVDWFVRVLRNGEYESYDDGTPFAKPDPEKFNYERENRDLYRYYMFRIKWFY